MLILGNQHLLSSVGFKHSSKYAWHWAAQREGGRSKNQRRMLHTSEVRHEFFKLIALALNGSNWSPGFSSNVSLGHTISGMQIYRTGKCSASISLHRSSLSLSISTPHPSMIMLQRSKCCAIEAYLNVCICFSYVSVLSFDLDT